MYYPIWYLSNYEKDNSNGYLTYEKKLMNKIKELIKNNEKYKQIVIQKRLTSKKNEAYLVKFNGKSCILKFFTTTLKKTIEMEYSILNIGSSKLNIPAPVKLDVENNVILISYINGVNLCDVINNKKTKSFEKQRIMHLLAKWLFNFHTFFQKSDKILIRGDSILRNFILTDRMWGVDFEESRYGQPMDDIACMCASILSTNPIFTDEKFILSSLLISNYEKLMHQELYDINNQISSALLENIQWRKNEKENIRKFADKIRNRDFQFKRI